MNPKTNEENYIDSDQELMHQTCEVNKSDNFDWVSWNSIFEYLSEEDLANVATVCIHFQTLAEQHFMQRKQSNRPLEILTNQIGWKPIICRFKHLISVVSIIGGGGVYGPIIHNNNSDILQFVEYFLNESLTVLNLHSIDLRLFKSFEFQRQFLKLETLSLINFNFDDENDHVITKLNTWCPNLKKLELANSEIGDAKFFLQSFPSIESFQLVDRHGFLLKEKLLLFLYNNRQLKKIFVDLPHAFLQSFLLHINESMFNVESVTVHCDDLDDLPDFQSDFPNLKKLSFLMFHRGSYTNQLLRIIQRLPKIEEIQIVNAAKLLICNDDLEELINQSSRTLKNLMFTSTDTKLKMQFGYDLHRKIYNGTSDVSIEFYTGHIFNENITRITKRSITKDGNLIVIGPSLVNC